MDTIVISHVVASDLIVGIAVVGCIILVVAAELTNDERTILKLLSRHFMAYSIPLLVLFAFIGIAWGTEIITD